MTPIEFDAVAQLRRMKNTPSRRAARLVLIGGLSGPSAANATGITVQGVYNVVYRVRQTHRRAKVAAGKTP